MKKSSLLLAAALLGLLFIQATTKPKSELKTPPDSILRAPNMPAYVKAIVETKCYGCHNLNSKK